MPVPTYIRFLQWAEARDEPFTYWDVEQAFQVPRELVVQLVSLALEKGRVERESSTHWRLRAHDFPGKLSNRKAGS